MTDTIEEAITGLAVIQKCPLVTDDRLAMMGYRKLLVKNYIVFFTIDEELKVVDVERILYTRRDWHHIL
ncbi:type II toxin-antitoxin system RelE/ParE family toxin [Candidatus Formimonas warabiya]|uniref:type II toxin-antitoxin system RelE/ParE family toxin n=1 Tax=Formimonas warabiya TaxID=1761012 RepID=UPI001F3F576C|nr:type II toxin-antitoxin system RelE/ParE family toxin [Candidatus Formimonas warabiya]